MSTRTSIASFALLLTTFPAMASDWFIESPIGDLWAESVQPGFLYRMTGPSTVWLPSDPADLPGCIMVMKNDSGPGPVRVETDDGAPIGDWPRIVLVMQGDAVEICADMTDYIALNWPTVGPQGQHRTFAAGYVGNGNTLTERCIYSIRDSDRGAVVRVSLVYNVCSASIGLPTRQQIRDSGLCGYWCGWRVEIQVVNRPRNSPWVVVVQPANGATIDDQAHFLVLRANGLLCLDFDGNNWYSCGFSNHDHGGFLP